MLKSHITGLICIKRLTKVCILRLQTASRTLPRMICLCSQRSRLYSPPLRSVQKRRIKAPASFINWKQLRKSRGRRTRTMTPLSDRSKISWNHRQKSTWKNISSLPKHCCDIRCSWTSSIPHAGGLFALLKGEYNYMTRLRFPPSVDERGSNLFQLTIDFLVCLF